MPKKGSKRRNRRNRRRRSSRNVMGPSQTNSKFVLVCGRAIGWARNITVVWRLYELLQTHGHKVVVWGKEAAIWIFHKMVDLVDYIIDLLATGEPVINFKQLTLPAAKKAGEFNNRLYTPCEAHPWVYIFKRLHHS